MSFTEFHILVAFNVGIELDDGDGADGLLRYLIDTHIDDDGDLVSGLYAKLVRNYGRR